jgi:hypothetical protein
MHLLVTALLSSPSKTSHCSWDRMRIPPVVYAAKHSFAPISICPRLWPLPPLTFQAPALCIPVPWTSFQFLKCVMPPPAPWLWSCCSLCLLQLPLSHSCPIFKSPSMVSDIGFLLHLGPQLSERASLSVSQHCQGWAGGQSAPPWPTEGNGAELPAGAPCPAKLQGLNKHHGNGTEHPGTAPMALPSH